MRTAVGREKGRKIVTTIAFDPEVFDYIVGISKTTEKSFGQVTNSLIQEIKRDDDMNDLHAAILGQM